MRSAANLQISTLAWRQFAAWAFWVSPLERRFPLKSAHPALCPLLVSVSDSCQSQSLLSAAFISVIVASTQNWLVHTGKSFTLPASGIVYGSLKHKRLQFEQTKIWFSKPLNSYVKGHEFWTSIQVTYESSLKNWLKCKQITVLWLCVWKSENKPLQQRICNDFRVAKLKFRQYSKMVEKPFLALHNSSENACRPACLHFWQPKPPKFCWSCVHKAGLLVHKPWEYQHLRI